DVPASDGNPAGRAELARGAGGSGQDIDVAAASSNASTGEVASAVDVSTERTPSRCRCVSEIDRGQRKDVGGRLATMPSLPHRSPRF
ncbi:MAG: hypothetical protein LBD97_09420, partial [Bifidobacteriaceae bacterium]|nr:hypothetical protein [Bifidobacteriaceae bacterium]